MWLILSNSDGHVIDTASSLSQAEDRSWWRAGVSVEEVNA